MKKRIKNIALIVVIIWAIAVLFGCNNNSGNAATNNPMSNGNDNKNKNKNENETVEEKAEIGYMAPDFSVELVGGKTVKLSDFRGKVVLINFWATWCRPCTDEMPYIQQLSDAFPDDLVVLAINCDERKNKVENFVNDNGYTFNVGFDEDGIIQKNYPKKGIPYTLIIDADGVITNTHLGASGDMFSVYAADVREALGE